MRQIRRKLQSTELNSLLGTAEFSGWYDGRKSYIGIWIAGKGCVGTLEGMPLYALAKRLVKEFEEDRTKEVRGG